MVLLDRHVPGLSADTVVTDQRAGLVATMTHLHDLGHRKIGLVTLPNHTRTTRELTASYRAACRRLGLPQRSQIVASVDMASGAHAVDHLLVDSLGAIVVCAPSLVLAGALERIDALGLKVPPTSHHRLRREPCRLRQATASLRSSPETSTRFLRRRVGSSSRASRSPASVEARDGTYRAPNPRLSGPVPRRNERRTGGGDPAGRGAQDPIESVDCYECVLPLPDRSRWAMRW